MQFRKIAVSTVLAFCFSITSTLTGQALTAYRSKSPFVKDWVPVAHFAIIAAVMTPPNFLWQEFLEMTWPVSPGPSPQLPAASKDASAAAKPKLSLRNVAIKTMLDQTVGNFVNNFMFSALILYMRATMQRRPVNLLGSENSGRALLSRAAYDFGSVNTVTVLRAARASWWPLVTASWRFWPFVSLIAFTTFQSILARQLFGAIAGVVWGVYLSMVV